MRNHIFLVVMFLTSCANGKSDTADQYRPCNNFPAIDSLIVRLDTISGNNKHTDQVVNYFDAKDRLLKTFSSNLLEPNLEDVHLLTNYYDTTGHIIYETKIRGTSQWYCCEYKYDSRGHLLLKESYNLGKPDLKVTYIYQGDKLIKEISESSTGKTTKEYYK